MSQAIELSSLVATFVKPSSRKGTDKMVEVKFAPSVTGVSYTVHSLSSEISGPNSCQGSVSSAADDHDISFTFPVKKKTHYLIKVAMHVGEDEHHAEWVLDPFKRRTVTKEDVAPAATAAQ